MTLFPRLGKGAHRFPGVECSYCGSTFEEQEQEAEEINGEEKKREGAYAIGDLERVEFDAQVESQHLDLDTKVWLQLRTLVLTELRLHWPAIPTDEIELVAFLIGWAQEMSRLFESMVVSDASELPPPPPAEWPRLNKKQAACLQLPSAALEFDRTSGPRVGVRSLRETLSECWGLWPTLGAVSIHAPLTATATSATSSCVAESYPAFGPQRIVTASDLTWHTIAEGEDPRDVWRGDGEADFTYPEFLIWYARLGGTLYGMQGNSPKTVPFNPLYASEEPAGYVPLCWTGEPKKWQAEIDSGFMHCHWMRGASDEVVALSKANADVCKVCQICREDAPKGRLLRCSCQSILYCSVECQKRDWKRHKKDGHKTTNLA